MHWTRSLGLEVRIYSWWKKKIKLFYKQHSWNEYSISLSAMHRRSLRADCLSEQTIFPACECRVRRCWSRSKGLPEKPHPIHVKCHCKCEWKCGQFVQQCQTEPTWGRVPETDFEIPTASSVQQLSKGYVCRFNHDKRVQFECIAAECEYILWRNCVEKASKAWGCRFYVDIEMLNVVRFFSRQNGWMTDFGASTIWPPPFHRKSNCSILRRRSMFRWTHIRTSCIWRASWMDRMFVYQISRYGWTRRSMRNSIPLINMRSMSVLFVSFWHFAFIANSPHPSRYLHINRHLQRDQQSTEHIQRSAAELHPQRKQRRSDRSGGRLFIPIAVRFVRNRR